jgi:hypothetical protein
VLRASLAQAQAPFDGAAVVEHRHDSRPRAFRGLGASRPRGLRDSAQPDETGS